VLAKADAESLPWVVVLHGDRLRLYPTAVGPASAAAGTPKPTYRSADHLLADEPLA